MRSDYKMCNASIRLEIENVMSTDVLLLHPSPVPTNTTKNSAHHKLLLALSTASNAGHPNRYGLAVWRLVPCRSDFDHEDFTSISAECQCDIRVDIVSPCRSLGVLTHVQ